MFAASILETSWAQRSRRSWTTLSSFGLQALAMGLLLLLPLIRPVAVPFLKPLQTPISMAHVPGPPANVQTRSRAAVLNQSNFLNHVPMAPGPIPRAIASDIEDTSEIGLVDVYDSHGPNTGSGSIDGVSGLFESGRGPVMPAPPRPVVQPTRVS